MSGIFIAIEGGEGAGKTSAMQAVCSHLEATGHEVVRTREPGGTTGAESIRNILVTAGNEFEPMANMLLFAAARADHVTKVIAPAIANGKTVVTDRYMLSTLAYQSAEAAMRDGEAAGVEMRSAIQQIHNMTAMLYPDVTILLDIDPGIGLARSLKRLANENSNEGHYESKQLQFHRQVRENFIRGYGESHNATIARIDAGLSEEEVKQHIITALQDALERSRARG